MTNKMKLLIGLLVLGAALIAVSLVLLLIPSQKSKTLSAADQAIINSFHEDFGFRGKQVSTDEASKLIEAKLPLPTWLPKGFAVQEIYAGVGNSTMIVLISDSPIEKIIQEPPDKPKDYPILRVKCKMRMYVSFKQDLRIVGGSVKPTPIGLQYIEEVDSNIINWSAQVDNKTASLFLTAKKDAAVKEDLIKMAESVK